MVIRSSRDMVYRRPCGCTKTRIAQQSWYCPRIPVVIRRFYLRWATDKVRCIALTTQREFVRRIMICSGLERCRPLQSGTSSLIESPIWTMEGIWNGELGAAIKTAIDCIHNNLSSSLKILRIDGLATGDSITVDPRTDLLMKDISRLCACPRLLQYLECEIRCGYIGGQMFQLCQT